ncbi:COesterase domain-containing protein [Mycena indigotica]|uniref:Carboxylic ester hydrolase n=1 Tax=Mycena indigotica TaxID=2126181 RepID=A0A8H6T6T0_9AGAR|nr:COesterase domain-containing protein [Mycena indigotica]KAF7311955.1 COesterase domain-containing protein [Mycena indigotica]
MLPLHLFAVLAVSALAAAQAPIVDLGYAQYQGSTSANITSFLGVRYAAAPLGDLRFRAPQSPTHVDGVQPAITEPNECFQAAAGTSAINPLEQRAEDAVTASEDCLFLNVYYPSDSVGTPPSRLPTLVWIHGGGYIGGAASSFNGGDIIKQSNNGVVVVLIQYRLGVFGFLPGASVKRDGALNAGLLDQDFALRWVNRHITKFGGDPTKVTIWGESAGAGSVLQHIIAHDGNTQPQLFRGAITSSTFLPSQYVFNDRVPELLFSKVLAQTNCTTASNSMACLRATSAATLETVNTNLNGAGFFGTFTFVPVIDGDFITQSAISSFREGKVNGKALLAVTNAFEGTAFVNQSAVITASKYSMGLFPKFGPAEEQRVGSLYAPLGNDLFQVNAVQGESIFICPSYFVLQAFAGRSWKAEFAVPPALHGQDVAFYFPSTSPPSFNNQAFINAFAQSFTSFIISLNPNVKVSTTITPLWSPFNEGNTEMLFNRTVAGTPQVQPIRTNSALLARCSFWNGVGHLTGQ